MDMLVQGIMDLRAYRGGTRNKFWGGLQSFITYACAIYECAKRIKYSLLNQGRKQEKICPKKKNQNRKGSKVIYEKVQGSKTT